ncbi:MAG: hypothetical protein HQL88_07685 [Magnetococcales bacterium]|nr:hypothetical protein [Magnetococcales bacterium]
MHNFLPTGMRPNRKSGFSFVVIMLIIGLVGALFSMAANTMPKLYECYLLRELANRVVGEYAELPLAEVQRRVNFELYRSRVTIPPETFTILPVGHGYRVTVRHIVPLMLRLGDKVITPATMGIENHENWEFFYATETP